LPPDTHPPTAQCPNTPPPGLLQVASEEKNTRDVDITKEVVLPSGVRYSDLRIGGGQSPARGMLVVISFM